MKLLLLCDMFPPAFAPRMGYLCKYLKRKGWDITVVTEHIEDQTFSFLCGNAKVTYVNFHNSKNLLIRQIQWGFILFADFFFNYKERKAQRIAERIIQEESFDVILCSTYRTFPLLAASRLAAKYNIPFVADLRDIVEQYAANEFIAHSFKTIPWVDQFIVRQFKSKLLKNRNKALRQTNVITTISPWHQKVLTQYCSHVELIYNGYDPEVFYPEQIKTDQFKITYTGRIISLEMRDPRLLLEALQKLDEEHKISPALCRVQWFIDKSSEELIRPLVQQYNLSSYMDYLGYIPADDVPRVLNSSSVLLQLANKAGPNGPKGFMTTKLFEAFAVNKPLLLVRSDESYMEETIRRTNAGVAAQTTAEAYDYLLYLLNEWKEKGHTSADTNKEIVDSFSREKQAEQFSRIFEVLTITNENCENG